MKTVMKRIQSELVLVIAGSAAVVSTCFVPPSREYLGYLDFKVLALLFCLMAVVAGIAKTGAFEVLSQMLTGRIKNTRLLSLVLILLCFFSSMFITNDVSLLTFVPLAIAVLSFASPKQLIFVITMQTIAANLGSMLMPVGNPQNLFLYSKFNMDISSFFAVTLPVCALSLILIVAVALCAKNSVITIHYPQKAVIAGRGRLICYCLLFLLCLTAVFGAVHYALVLAVVCVAIFLLDKSIFKKVDYSLLLTFLFFFVFVGNLSSIQPVRVFFAQLINGRELLCAILLSQIISNVPAAVMLSSFTNNSTALVAGTNIGGLGSLVASLASLISFKLYAKSPHASTKDYLKFFMGINIALLLILTLFAELLY